jgi:protoporphyrinogen/coproporphyrinogen III oxidase
LSTPPEMWDEIDYVVPTGQAKKAAPYHESDRSSDPGITARVVVIGGGLSGLAAAHRIHERRLTLRRPVELLVLEAKEQTGGVIRTDRFDGFCVEGGPDSFITNKPWGIELCGRLGLKDQLIETDAHHRRSFVVKNGRLVSVPEGFVVMAPLRLMPMLTTPILSWRGKLRFLMDLVIPRRDDDSDESLAAFVRRRMGREALDRLVQPLVASIYTADPNDLSLRATLPQFLAMERDHRSLILAGRNEARLRGPRHVERQASGARYGMFVTLAEGMDTLPNALAQALPAGTIRTKTAVRRISRNEPASAWLVELLDGPPIEADAVIIATEAHAAARFLDADDQGLSLQLRAIPYASSLIVSVAYRRDQISHPLDGFGAVVPAIEGRSILAVSFLSVKFPNRAPAGTALLRVFIGGATHPEQFELDDAAIAELVKRELGELIGAGGEPLFIRIGRHPRSMPQYILGHLDRVATIRRHLAKYSRLYLAGIAYDGVGIPDCIHAAELTADALLDALANPAASAA